MKNTKFIRFIDYVKSAEKYRGALSCPICNGYVDMDCDIDEFGTPARLLVRKAGK